MKKAISCLLVSLILITSCIGTFTVSAETTNVEYGVDPYYIITIPQTAEPGSNLVIGAANINTESGKQVVVVISDGISDGDAMLVRQDAGGNPEIPLSGQENLLLVPVTLDDTPVSNSTQLAVFSGTSTTNQISGTLSIGTPDTSNKKAGKYIGTLSFAISYESVFTEPETVGAATPITQNAQGEYVVMSGTDWLWITQNYFLLSNKTIKLGKNLDMSLYGNSAAVAQLPSQCVFDGQNHRIKLNIDGAASGLFSSAYSGTIKNLTVEGSINNPSSLAAGGIVGYASITGSTFSIINCVNYASISVSYSNTGYFASGGGIIGRLSADNSTISVTNCRNEGQITASHTRAANAKAGGILGYYGTTAAYVSNNIQNCTNNGTVSSTGDAGGIVGYVIRNVNIDSCTNTGTISKAGVDKTTAYPIYGLRDTNFTALFTVTNCTPSTQNGSFS